MQNGTKRPFIESKWFKVILLAILFTPSYSELPYDPRYTTDLIAAVLSHPVIVDAAFLLPIAKLLLLLSVIVVFTASTRSSRAFFGYYALALAVTGIFQNMAHTQDYGFVWLIGNTVVMLIISVLCAWDAATGKSTFKRKSLNAKRLWVLAPMFLAFLMPYSVNKQGVMGPEFGLSVLTNEAGVTYCMITPVVIGTMLVFWEGVHKPTLSIISFIGLGFGIMNMLTWFVFQNQNWWMGILHLPLVILSFYATLLLRSRRAA